MPYRTLITGKISIEPPLNWAQIRQVQELHKDTARKLHCLALQVDAKETQTDEGELVTRTAHGITGAREEAIDAYTIVEELQQIIDIAPQSMFCGHLQGVGEDPMDFWRLTVLGGAATKVQPEIVWPLEAW